MATSSISDAHHTFHPLSHSHAPGSVCKPLALALAPAAAPLPPDILSSVGCGFLASAPRMFSSTSCCVALGALPRISDVDALPETDVAKMWRPCRCPPTQGTDKTGSWRHRNVCGCAGDLTWVAIRTPRVLVVVHREKVWIGRQIVERGLLRVLELGRREVGEERMCTLGCWFCTGDAYGFRAPASSFKSIPASGR